jgi:hypothetical protein
MFIGLKPYVQASQDIINAIFEVVIVLVSSAKSMGLAWKLMVEGRSLKYKAKHRGLCTEY